MECELSHAGCEIKVIRRDLFSHSSGNMATHLSLLAVENQELKSHLEDQIEAITSFMECKEELNDERKEMKKLLRQQAAIIEVFCRQARKQSRTSVAGKLLASIKFKRRRKSV